MDDDVRTLLTRAADSFGPVQPPPAALFERHHRHRRLAVSVLAPACVVLIVVALAVALHDRGQRPVAAGPSVPATASPTAPPSTTPTPAVGVAALAKYRWSTLPPAPIVARDGAVGVWTGSQLIVWGGANGDQAYADGAAYTPKTHAWTRLPQSPLTARTSTAFAWTGSTLFIWGGQDGAGHQLTDGALYDPTSRRWTLLHAAPAALASGHAPTAHVLGSEVVVLAIGAREGIVDASFDLGSRSWRQLPTPPEFVEPLLLTAVSTGNVIFLQSAWTDVQRGEGGTTGGWGIDGFTLDAASRSWSKNKVRPPVGRFSGTPIWTGDRVLLPALDVWCGYCSHPYITGRSGVVVNPSTGARTKIPHGPVDDLGATYLWTGAAMLGVNTSTETSGPHEHIYPGNAAAWNPTSNTWTSLAPAPLHSAGGVTVWTGSSVLIWGTLYDRKSSSHKSATTGLQFAAP